MARIRTIKPEAFVFESLAVVTLTAERTFFWAVSLLSIESRLPALTPTNSRGGPANAILKARSADMQASGGASATQRPPARV